MKLVMYYMISGDDRLFCEWKRVRGNEKFARIVCDFVKGLPCWQNSLFYGFEKLSPEGNVVKAFNAHFIQNASETDSKKMIVKCQVEEGEDIIEREEFCKAVDVLLKDAPAHARKLFENTRKFFKNFANDPETTDCEIQIVMDMMLARLFDSANRA